MTEKFPSTAFGQTHPSIFSHGELRQVLSTYAEGVLNKGWRDYAITCEAKQTTFCVIERGQGIPQAVIYSISKAKSAKQGGKPFYRVFNGSKQVCRTEKFLEALIRFRNPDHKKKPNLRSC
jgi:hypothetical protein